MNRRTCSRADSLLPVTQLKMEAIRLGMKIPKPDRGEMRARQAYSELLNKIRRYEKLEDPVYLLRYE